MRMIEAVEKLRYGHADRAVGEQFEAEPQHARALVSCRKAKYVGEDQPAAQQAVRPRGRPRKEAQ